MRCGILTSSAASNSRPSSTPDWTFSGAPQQQKGITPFLGPHHKVITVLQAMRAFAFAMVSPNIVSLSSWGCKVLSLEVSCNLKATSSWAASTPPPTCTQVKHRTESTSSTSLMGLEVGLEPVVRLPSTNRSANFETSVKHLKTQNGGRPKRRKRAPRSAHK